MTLIILDNSVTAMTGQQSNPSTVFTAGWKEGKKVSIEKICKAIGVEFVEVVDSYDVKNNVKVFQKALEFDGSGQYQGSCKLRPGLSARLQQWA